MGRRPHNGPPSKTKTKQDRKISVVLSDWQYYKTLTTTKWLRPLALLFFKRQMFVLALSGAIFARYEIKYCKKN